MGDAACRQSFEDKRALTSAVMCKLQLMVTDLYLTVVGTAVPIIALANQVIIIEAGGLRAKFYNVPFGPKPIRSDNARSGKWLTWLAFWGAIINMLNEATIFGNVLFQAYGTNIYWFNSHFGVGVTGFDSPGMVITYQVIGLLLLIATAVMLGIAKGNMPEDGDPGISKHDVQRLAEALVAALRELQQSPRSHDMPESPQSDRH